MDEVREAPQQEQESTALTAPAGQVPSIWNDTKMMSQGIKMAKMLATSDLVPEQTYKNKPANCLIALDLANRMSFPPLLVMKHLYIVKGKPAWSGKFCISIINSCGLFSPLEFITTEKGCYAQATRLSNGKLCVGPEVTWDMVKAEGWLDKSGSKWKTMPDVMFKYRAASFFAGTFCPEKLEGIPTVEEMQDVNGYEEAPAPEKVIITLED